MFFTKICSPWRKMLIQSYKVPEGQLDSVARRMSFLKGKLKDWCYQASIQKNMKRLRGLHPKDLDEQIPDPQDEPLQEELSDWPIPEPTKVSKTAIAGPAEQRVTYLQTARRNVVNYANSKPRMTSLMQSIMAIWYLFTNSKTFLQMKASTRRRWKLIRMDLQPNQSKYNEGDRLQTSESLSGFFSRMTLIPKEEILEELSKLREEVAITMKWIHIGAIEVVIKATFKEGIDSEIHLSIMDRRINNLRDGCLGTMIGNLYAGKLMFDIHPRIAYNLADQDFSRVLTLHQDFKRKDLMKEGNRPYSITYRIAYALSNTHHSDLFLRKEYIEIPRIFKEFAKVMTPDPIKIPRIGGVDLVIKDHPVLEQTLSTRTEFSSRMSFSEDRIVDYRGKEKELIKTFTPQEIRQPIIGRYEGMLEIAGHEILVAGVAGKENGSMTLGLNFLEDHKPWGKKGSGICTAKPGVFPKEAMKTLPVIAGRNFSQKILILNKGIREAKIIIGGAFGSPWFRVKTPPIYFHDTGADILLGNNFIQTFANYVQDNNRNLLIFTTNCGSEIQVMRRDKAFNRIMPINFRSKRGDFDVKLTHPKMQDKRKFGKALLSFRQQGLIESDSFYEESEKEIINLKEALQEIKSLDISEESKLSLENVKRLI
ncbi:UNVERIFIED_CONTAM: movement protein [Sesamum latifolium]|uniref:Movement protein n=1 Tax=Sesamum latifolium TaxID=2727402 RepID=A0AAW2X0Z3_9LAMI